MALVPITHVYDTLSVINNTGLLDGQILYTTDQTVNKIFADVKVNNILRRIEIGGTNEIDTVLNQESGHAIANSAVAKLAQTVHTNLLNPTLGTTTINGVTCTANGDGTYTLNGTASADIVFSLQNAIDTLDLPKTYRLVGCPSGGSASTFELNAIKIVGSTRTVLATDRGQGTTHEYPSGAKYEVRIRIGNGAVIENATFKPMLTTDLSATYDDYVQYSGDGELNQNVASLYNNLNTTNSNVTALDTKVGAQSLLPTPSQSVTQNINTLKAEINQINSDLSDSKNWKSYGTTGITQVTELMTGVANRITIPKTASELVISGHQWSVTVPLITEINRGISFYYGNNYMFQGFVSIDAQYMESVNKVVVFSICVTQIGALDSIARGYINGIYYR